MKKFLFLLTLVITCHLSFSQFVRNSPAIVDSVKVPASFVGGEIALQKFILDSLYINDQTDKGTVIIEFDVWADGSLHNWRFKKKMRNPQNNRSAVFLFLRMPDWNPGYNEKGKPLSTSVELEIEFNPPNWDGKTRYVPGNGPQDREPLPKKPADKIVDFANTEPEFPGGRDALDKFILDNMVLPNDGISASGTIYVQFVVWQDGYIGNIKVLRGINADLDKAVINALEKTPKWNPGTDMKDKPVNVRFTVPVRVG